MTALDDCELLANANLKGDALKSELLHASHEPLGLILVPDRRPSEMLVVEKAGD